MVHDDALDPVHPTPAPAPAGTAAFRRVTTAEHLETLVGTAPPMILMKQVDRLDAGCLEVLAASPLAGFGSRDASGRPTSTLVGGERGFVRAESPTRVSLAVEDDAGVRRDGVSMVLLVPGVGETLRLNGRVARSSRGRVEVDVDQVYVHCARSILRAGLWSDPAAAPAGPTGTAGTGPSADGPSAGAPEPGPLEDPAVAGLLAASPFFVVSTWDTSGSGDTSPRGDAPGVLHVLDGATLAFADRKGNRRADTLHNLLEHDTLSLAAVVPGRPEVLHARGTAFVTDDEALLARLAVGGRPPRAAVVVRVDEAAVTTSGVLGASGAWDASSHAGPDAAPDLNALGAAHIAASGSPGRAASRARLLGRAMAAISPRLSRAVMNIGYRKQLRKEGYDQAAGRPAPRHHGHGG